MDSRDRCRAMGHRKVIWIKLNPKEQFSSLGYIYAYAVTFLSARLHPKTLGYKILSEVTSPRLSPLIVLLNA